MSVIAYEKRLNADRRWALEEGGMHFERESEVYNSLKRVTGRLAEISVPYVIVGGMAMFLHGYRRFTEDVDVLVTADGLKKLHEELEGRGYLPPFANSKNLRDSENGVRIEFLVTGEFPGDGKPKPVAFPDPDAVTTIIEGIRCVNLMRLIELKLASGMTNPGRLKDLADVQEMIGQLNLSLSFDEQLDPFVRDQFRQLHIAVSADQSRRES